MTTYKTVKGVLSVFWCHYVSHLKACAMGMVRNFRAMTEASLTKNLGSAMYLSVQMIGSSLSSLSPHTVCQGCDLGQYWQ